MKIISLSILYIFFSINLFAQQTFLVSGTILSSKGEQMESVTVFIDGTSRVTKTDANGRYEFADLSPGQFMVVTSRLGYVSERKPLVLSSPMGIGSKNSVAMLDFTMQEKSISLDEVRIGNNSRRAEMLIRFKSKFLGFSENAQNCKILNTELLEFTSVRNSFLASSSDFLIIENQNLGYRIRYLLKNFSFNASTYITNYNGNCIFEELPGSRRKKMKWAENRKKAYEGSLMHYLRCLYDGSLPKTNFKTLMFVDDPGGDVNKRTIVRSPVDMGKYTSRVDSTFIKFGAKSRFLVMYGDKVDQMMAELKKEGIVLDRDLFSKLGIERSEFNFFLDHTLVDKNGSYLDYRTFLLDGFWGGRQMGDRLPFSYWPE